MVCMIYYNGLLTRTPLYSAPIKTHAPKGSTAQVPLTVIPVQGTHARTARRVHFRMGYIRMPPTFAPAPSAPKGGSTSPPSSIPSINIGVSLNFKSNFHSIHCL